MTLLKNDDTLPPKKNPVTVESWPKHRMSEGIGLSIKDGWNVGIGFGLAMTIALPIIIILFACIIGIGLSILGSSLSSIF